MGHSQLVTEKQELSSPVFNTLGAQLFYNLNKVHHHHHPVTLPFSVTQNYQHNPFFFHKFRQTLFIYKVHFLVSRAHRNLLPLPCILATDRIAIEV